MIQSCLYKTGFLCLGLLLGLALRSSAQSPSATLTLVGPDTICAGLPDTFSITFSDGNPPYIFFYSINGVPLSPDTTANNPHIFLTPLLSAGEQIIRLDSVSAAGMPATVSGSDTITVLPAPVAVLQSDTVQLCAGQTDTLRIKLSGPGPYTFQYAIGLDTMAPITTADTLFNIPVTPPAGQTLYRLIRVSGGSCNGSVSGNVLANVTALPTAALQGDTVICPGQSAALNISFAGSAPFVVHYTANGTPQPADTSFFNPRILIVNPDTTTVYQLTSVSTNGCAGTASGQATVQVLPQLTATISGGGQICQGGTGTTISIAFTGPGPYTFVYRAGLVNQPPITTNANPFVLPVNPPNGTIYRLVSVSNGTCTGTVTGTAVVAVFTPSTADLMGDLVFCDSANTILTVDFTGSGPFTLVYTANGVTQDTVQTFDDPYFIPVNITSTTVYKLVSVESPGCFGDADGQATVTINYAPRDTNILVNCNLANGTYTVEFDVVGATLPLSVVTGSGTFMGTHFVSNPIPVDSNYAISFHDANDCADILVSGISNCSCSSAAGNMNTTPINACAGDTITALHLGNAMLDSDDSLRFILHTNPGTPTAGQILAWNNVPSFVYGAGLSVNTTYYISAVAGNPDPAGNIDFSDPCLSVSAGTPVLWRPLPTATIDAAFDICPGQQVLIPVTFTGQAPFTLTFTKNGQTSTVLALQNTFSISATLLDTAIYQAVGVSNAQCVGTASGQAVVNVHPAPQIANDTAVCAPDNLTYTLEFDVVGSDLNTAVVTGSVTGNYNPQTGHFVSDPVQAQTPYAAVVADVWQCGQDTISGEANCACVTDAGLLNQTPMTLCNGDTAKVAGSSGFFLAPGDTLVYLLVTTTDPSTWNVIAQKNNPAFSFDPMLMAPGSTYFMVAVAGDIAATGVNFSDACLSIAPGPALIWQAIPEVALGADTDICAGDTANLAVLFSGNAPYVFTYAIDGVSQPQINATGTSHLLSVSPAVNSNYTLVSATAAGCPANLTGSAAVTVHALPQILDTLTVCDLSTLRYTLQFNISNGAAPNLAYTVSGLPGVVTDSSFVSAPIPSGQPYNLVVSTPAGCTAALSGSAYCACVTEAGAFSSTAPVNICLPNPLNLPPVSGALLGSGDTLLYILNQNPAQLPAGIFATAASPQFSLQPGMQAGTVYYVSAVAGNVLPNGSIDFTDPCLDIAPAVPVVFRQPPTASIFGDTTICRSSNTLFRITFTGKSPYQFVYSINGVQQTAVSAPQNLFTITTNNVQQSQLFQLVSVQDAYCPGTVSGSYTVNIQNGPTAKLLSNTSICPGDTALLRLQLTGASLFDLTIDGGPTPLQLNGVQNGATFSVTPAATTSYSIGAFSAQGNTCADTIGPGVTVTVAPALLAQATLSDYGGFNVSCPGETDGSISLAVSGGLGAATANWSNGNTGYNLQNLSAGTYSVSLTDTLGCSIQDSFTLTGPEPLQINYSLENPRCHNEATGVLRLLDIQGGLGPFALSLNGQTAQVIAGFPQAFQNLAAGAISLAVEDVNGCATQIDTSLANPPLFTVQLGPDATLYPGDSVFLNPVLTGAPVDSLLWTPAAGLNTPTELNTFAQPANTVLYKLWVQDTAGCQASDELRITVRKDYRFYAPTVFQPGARAPNHLFTFYAGPEVRNIRIVRIYDRWGGLVFDRQNVTPNHSDQGWDGRWNGQDVGPGVYIWMAELELADGATELKSGDVTVLR